MMRSSGMAVVVAVTVLLAACSDLDVKPLPTIGSDSADPVVPNPSFASDIQPIFTARCAIAGCHITPTEANLNLVLTDPPTSYQNLVGVPSAEFPGMIRVQAGDAAGSYLMFKLDTGEMPKNGPMLSQGTRDTIRNWIDQGAQNN